MPRCRCPRTCQNSLRSRHSQEEVNGTYSGRWWSCALLGLLQTQFEVGDAVAAGIEIPARPTQQVAQPDHEEGQGDERIAQHAAGPAGAVPDDGLVKEEPSQQPEAAVEEVDEDVGHGVAMYGSNTLVSRIKKMVRVVLSSWLLLLSGRCIATPRRISWAGSSSAARAPHLHSVHAHCMLYTRLRGLQSMAKDGRGRLQSCREEQVSLQALMAIKFDCMDLQLAARALTSILGE
jgi:hypothetical protein